MNTLNESDFWAIVSEMNWPHDGVDAAKLRFMQTYPPETAEAFRKVFAQKKRDITAAANVDWCCDSWDDTRAHVIGLGETEFRRHIESPQLILDREARGDYVESFAYVIPYPDDYGLLTDDGYDGMLRQVAEFSDQLAAADPDDVPPRLYRRCSDARSLCELFLQKRWSEAVALYHELYGPGYSDDWPFSRWCGYLIPNLVRDLERYRLIVRECSE